MNFSLEDQKINTYDCAIRWLAKEKRTYRISSLLYTSSCSPVSEKKNEIGPRKRIGGSSVAVTAKKHVLLFARETGNMSARRTGFEKTREPAVISRQTLS